MEVKKVYDKGIRKGKKITDLSKLKVGQRVVYYHNGEKALLKIKKINLAKREIDATWKTSDVLLVTSDFEKGYVFEYTPTKRKPRAKK